MSNINKKSLFPTNQAGMVELTLTPEEVTTIMESLVFSQNIMTSAASRMEKVENITEEEKDEVARLHLRSYTTSIVYERLLADLSGDEPTPSDEMLN